MSTNHSDTTGKIRELNDLFRNTFLGGRVYMTPGIQSLPEEEREEVLTQVRTFDQFTEDNDPHGEHDFGSITHRGQKVFFKIDYYDRQLQKGSEDPSDPAQTVRVLTVMLASEY